MSGLSDHDLLADFAEKRSEPAFAALVQRQINFVYSAAIRLMVDPHLAEDVTQSVFVVLSREADSVLRKLQSGTPLSAWLHVTTRNIAAQTVRTEMRRRAREKEAAAMLTDSSPDPNPLWDRAAPHIDAALGDLAEPDRHAILLRFVEKRTARQIGEDLGVSEDAAQKRVTRALDRLRDALLARGIAASTAALATAISTQAVQAAPAGLAALVTKSAFVTGAAAVPVAVSTKFVLPLLMTKTQTATVALLVGVLFVPIAIQQARLSDLRSNLVVIPEQPPSAIRETTPGNFAVPAESEADELARLRKTADDLRTALAQRRNARAQTSPQKQTAGPVLLKPGRSVGLGELTFAGTATPEATAQSVFVARRNEDLDELMRYVLLPPDQLEEWNQIASSPETRAAAIKHMTEDVKKASAIELLAAQPVDEKRTMLTFRITAEGQIRTNRFTYGYTGSGWKEAMQ